MELGSLVDGESLAGSRSPGEEGEPGATPHPIELVAAIRPGELNPLAERGPIVLCDELRELFLTASA